MCDMGQCDATLRARPVSASASGLDWTQAIRLACNALGHDSYWPLDDNEFSKVKELAKSIQAQSRKN